MTTPDADLRRLLEEMRERISYDSDCAAHDLTTRINAALAQPASQPAPGEDGSYTALPPGEYRVVNGKLHKILPGIPPELRAQPAPGEEVERHRERFERFAAEHLVTITSPKRDRLEYVRAVRDGNEYRNNVIDCAWRGYRHALAAMPAKEKDAVGEAREAFPSLVELEAVRIVRHLRPKIARMPELFSVALDDIATLEDMIAAEAEQGREGEGQK